MKSIQEVWKVFGTELWEIGDREIRDFTGVALQHAPTYWWTVESSRKYHPKDERKKFGRILHAKRAVRMCGDLARHPYQLNPIQRDMLISAALLHDICVRGLADIQMYDGATFNHPALVRDRLERVIVDFLEKRPRQWMEQHIEMILKAIESHMGRWGPVTPDDDLGKILHMVDYIVSREWVRVDVLPYMNVQPIIHMVEEKR